MHALLKRQLDRHALSADAPPDEATWRALVAAVSESYGQQDEARYVLERSLEVSSHEMREMYDALEQESQAQLRRERDRLQSIFRALNDGVCTLDAEGRCLSANLVATRYLGVSEEQLVGGPLLDRVALSPNQPASAESFLLLWMSIKNRLALSFEQASLARPSGEWLSISCVFNPLIEQGEVIGCVMVFRDVTQQRRAEQELLRLNEELREARDQALEASKSKSTFLANMSHELRTPLNAIIGYSELLREDALADGLDDMAEDARKINVSADHLLHVINDILDLSKIEAGKMEVFPERFTLSELVDQVRTTVAPLIQRNRNELEVQLEGSAQVALLTDKVKLRQALINVMSNAAKFTEDGTITLSVTTHRRERQLWLRARVTDTGIGIPPDRLEQLFDAFTQGDQSTTRQYGGTGLGLSITRQFCRMLGGEISVDSVVGEGSTFEVMVPTTLPGEGTISLSSVFEGEDSGALSALPAPGGQLATVLMIDDDATVFDLAQRFLKPEGFHLLRARNGREGLELARAHHPDVITLDVMMPELDGWSTLSALKSDPQLAHIPVVMMTIVAERQRGFALGAADYLPKPIDRGRLISTLRRHCEMRGDTRGDVLIVEDDEQTRQILHRTLSSRGWQVREAAHGVAAMTQLRERAPDVVLLDLMMPLMDGFQVLDAMREDEALAQIPVIVLTARDLSLQETQRLHQRASQVLQKGDCGMSVLIDKIRLAAKKPSLEVGLEEVTSSGEGWP